jgi:hypothetical protein
MTTESDNPNSGAPSILHSGEPRPTHEENEAVFNELALIHAGLLDESAALRKLFESTSRTVVRDWTTYLNEGSHYVVIYTAESGQYKLTLEER